jgi:cation diffusion facilitator family transporter
VSAGIESSGDVVAAVLTLFAIRLGARPADENHPYGHRRAENLGALGKAAILTGGGIVVVVEAIGRLAGHGRPVDTHWYVFAVIVVALAVDLSRLFVSLGGAARYRSAALRSNAFHFANDMAGSLIVLAGLDTMPGEAHARAHQAISELDADIELRRLPVRESGGRYFADAVVRAARTAGWRGPRHG